jgi:hypothetical protein
MFLHFDIGFLEFPALNVLELEILERSGVVASQFQHRI